MAARLAAAGGEGAAVAGAEAVRLAVALEAAPEEAAAARAEVVRWEVVPEVAPGEAPLEAAGAAVGHPVGAGVLCFDELQVVVVVVVVVPSSSSTW